MGFITGALITLAVGAGATLLYKSAAEERKRKNTPCIFGNTLTRDDFTEISNSVCKSIKRVTEFTIDAPIIQGTVRSQSGISEWKFKIDFNDYGNVSGKYWIETDNSDSDIPSVIAERIKEVILNK